MSQLEDGQEFKDLSWRMDTGQGFKDLSWRLDRNLKISVGGWTGIKISQLEDGEGFKGLN